MKSIEDAVSMLKGLGWRLNFSSEYLALLEHRQKKAVLHVYDPIAAGDPEYENYEMRIIKFSLCPRKAFDRWANSRHVNFEASSNWSISDTTKELKRALRIMKRHPIDDYNKGMRINL